MNDYKIEYENNYFHLILSNILILNIIEWLFSLDIKNGKNGI